MRDAVVVRASPESRTRNRPPVEGRGPRQMDRDRDGDRDRDREKDRVIEIKVDGETDR